MTLDAFLAARLDEDEAAAKAVRPDQDYADSEHQERWSPGRVLREVAAKRAILTEHRPVPSRFIESSTCALCTVRTMKASTPVRWPCETMRALAAVYSDHPDYNNEWKVQDGETIPR
jgi:Family of unknown function (DUF6221)